ncbi:Extracellular solute-binding protein, family 3, partial [gut metagenome]
ESNYYPFSYLTETGDRTGFDFDIAQAICKEMNVVCLVTPYPFKTLLEKLKVSGN